MKIVDSDLGERDIWKRIRHCILITLEINTHSWPSRGPQLSQVDKQTDPGPSWLGSLSRAATKVNLVLCLSEGKCCEQPAWPYQYITALFRDERKQKYLYLSGPETLCTGRKCTLNGGLIIIKLLPSASACIIDQMVCSWSPDTSSVIPWRLARH